MVINTLTGFTNIQTPILLPALAQSPKAVKKLWVDYNFFCRTAKSLTDANKRQLKTRKRFEFNSKGEVNLISISNTDRAKYGIAYDNDVVIAIIEQLKLQDADKLLQQNTAIEQNKVNQVHDHMFIAQKEFPVYRSKITKAYPNLPKEKSTEFAKRWAVWVWIMDNYTRFGRSLETYHAAYSLIFPTHFAGANGKISFRNFYGACQNDGIENSIIDRRAITKAKNRRSPLQMAFLQTLFIQKRKVVAADAYRKLVEYCKGLNTGKSHERW